MASRAASPKAMRLTFMPMSKETYYFSHDYNAFQDPKISKMVLKMGIESYGIFWAVVEMIYNQDGKLEADYELISHKLFSDAKKIERVVNDFNLFKVKKGYIVSDSIDRRLLLRREKSEKARQSSLQRRTLSERSTNDKRTINDSLAIKERKGKEIKEKRKEPQQNTASEIAVFVAPTFNEVRAYFHEMKLYESNPVNFFADVPMTPNWKQDAINYANGKR